MSYSNFPPNPPQLPTSAPPPYAGGYPAVPGATTPYPYRPVVAAKTPGVAILLSLLWLGAGHLYANRIGTGLVLVAVEALLALLSLSVVGLVIAIPIWVVMLPIAMVSASAAATGFNQQHGM